MYENFKRVCIGKQPATNCYLYSHMIYKPNEVQNVYEVQQHVAETLHFQIFILLFQIYYIDNPLLTFLKKTVYQRKYYQRTYYWIYRNI